MLTSSFSGMEILKKVFLVHFFFCLWGSQQRRLFHIRVHGGGKCDGSEDFMVKVVIPLSHAHLPTSVRSPRVTTSVVSMFDSSSLVIICWYFHFLICPVYHLSRIIKDLRFYSLLEAGKLACHNFMDAGGRHGGRDEVQFITQSSGSS